MDQHEHESPINRLTKHNFIILIIGSIVASIVLVLVSLGLYVTSGTAQLDLSRPGYEAIRDKVKNDDSFTGFDPSGKIDEAALVQFNELYGKKLKDAQSVPAFDNDVLSPKSLQIDDQAAKQDATNQ